MSSTRAVLGMALLGGALLETSCLETLAGNMVERQVERTFTVAAGSSVQVRISGGGITAAAGEPGSVRVVLRERIAADSSAEADRVLQDYEIVIAQEGDEVRVLARPKDRRQSNRVHVSVELTAPPDVRLDLGTSGGGIRVRGDRQGALRAETSGGGIEVDGGAGDLDLDTSGGGITVGRALGVLSADTSGGGITVEYVGRAARQIDLDTSGGGIRVGVDPAASLAIAAATSGGGVQIEGLPFRSESRGRSRARGTINDGAGQLRAQTSGGSIVVRAASR